MDIVITLAGHSRRFYDAGFTIPKFLIELDGSVVLEHVLDMFSENDIFHFVINETQVSELPGILLYLQKIRPKTHVNIIKSHDLGPVHSVRQVSSLSDNTPFIVSYCDFYVEWNYAEFLNSVAEYKCAIPAFKGFHPASFGNTMYAYMHTDDDDHLIELREKKSFTQQRDKEFASVGLYYFDNFKNFCYYANLLHKTGFGDLQEGYVSLLANMITADGHKVKVTTVEKFLCFGTPSDIDHYQFWQNYFRNTQHSNEPINDARQKTNNIIPIAGRGNRFKKDRIQTLKPFINVGKTPMLSKACRSLPPAKKWYFIALQEDAERYPVRALAEKSVNGPLEIITTVKPTSGQLSSCILAERSLDDDDHVLISSCDYEVIYDKLAWLKSVEDTQYDGFVWCIRAGPVLYKDPEAFAYCITNELDDIEFISEKKTISPTPENDPLAIGVFWFRRASDFKLMAREAFEKVQTINGEYYVATAINLLISKGMKFKVFYVDQWISYGDPFELDMYNYWEDYFWKRGRNNIIDK